LEGSRTNSLGQSEYFGAWALNSAGISSIQPNYAVSPEGLKNAYKVNFIVQSDSDLALAQTHSITGGSTYAYSIYIKGEGSNIGKDVVVKSKRIGGGDSAGTTTTQTLTNEWKRIDFNTTYAANNINGRLLISSNDATSCLVYGAQAELGSYPTSYIPNHSGGSVTRGADLCTKTGVSSLIGQTEGTLFLEAEAQSGFRTFSICDGSTSNRISIVHNVPSDFRVIPVYGGVVGTQLSTSYTSGNIKIAVAYGGGNYSMFVNGVKINSTSIGTFSSTLNKIEFAQGNGGNPFAGDVNQVLTFPTKLSNAELATLTTL
jgi:hypothetical protein